MNRERSSSSNYVTYLRHTSSSAASPAQSLSASPDSLATIMKNSLLLTSIEIDEAQFAENALGGRRTEGT